MLPIQMVIGFIPFITLEQWEEHPVNENLYSLDDSVGLQVDYTKPYVLSPEYGISTAVYD